MEGARRSKCAQAAPAVLLGTALTVTLRFYHIGGASLWFDEGYSAWISRLAPGRIIQVMRGDVSPPLYYLILSAWTAIFSDGEVALRSLSAVASCVGVILIAALAWQLTRNSFSTAVASLLASVSVLQIQYAQEARSYALSATLTFVAALAFTQTALTARRAWLVIAVLSCIACVYLHNMMWFYLAALNLAYLLMPGPHPVRRRIVDLVMVDAIVLIAFLPWLPAMLAQMTWLKGNFWATTPAARDLADVCLSLCGAKPMHLHAMLPHAPAVTAFAICCIALAAFALFSAPRATLALLAFFAFPILVVFGYAHLRQSFFLEKAFLASTLAMPLFTAVALTGSRKWLTSALSSLLLLLTIVSVFGYFRLERKEDWRSAVAWLNEQPRNDTLVVFVANEGEYLYNYYTRQDATAPHQRTGAPQGFFDLDPPRTIQRILSSSDLARLSGLLDLERPRIVLLVRAHTEFSDPMDLTHAMLQGRFGQPVTTRFHLIAIDRFASASGAEPPRQSTSEQSLCPP